jgi:hypothetical protein
MHERSGTDQQIADRIRRGYTSAQIRDELGCGAARIKEIAKHYGLMMRSAKRLVPGQRVLNRTARLKPACNLPQLQISLPEGWGDVVILYPLAADPNGVVEIRKVKNG